MVGTEFINVTIATDDHNKDSVSVEPGQVIVVVNNGSTSTSYVEVDETPIEDYGQDVLKLDAGKEAHDQGEPSENDGQRAVHNNNRIHIGGNKKFHILNCSVPEIDGDKVLVLIDIEYHLFFTFSSILFSCKNFSMFISFMHF